MGGWRGGAGQGSFDLQACSGRVASEHHSLAQVRQDGDASPADFARKEHLGSCDQCAAASQPVLVQVHLHGRDAGQCGRGPTGLRAVDAMGAGGAGVVFVYQDGAALQGGVRFVMVHPEVRNWIRYARFEQQHGSIPSARGVFERAVDFFGDDNLDEQLFVAFARFEEQQKEYERSRVIYKYALERIPRQNAEALLKGYTQFEKRFGDRRGIESVVVSKRRFQYEEEVKANPANYDAWFDYLRLVEGRR